MIIPVPNEGQLKVTISEACMMKAATCKTSVNNYWWQIKELEEKLSYSRNLLSSKKIDPDDVREMKSEYTGKVEKLETR